MFAPKDVSFYNKVILVYLVEKLRPSLGLYNAVGHIRADPSHVTPKNFPKCRNPPKRLVVFPYPKINEMQSGTNTAIYEYSQMLMLGRAQQTKPDIRKTDPSILEYDLKICKKRPLRE